MIKLFALNSNYKPFFENEFTKEYLLSNGVTYTHKIQKADIIICGSTSGLLFKITKILKLIGKRIIVWTNEPRIDTTFKNFKSKNIQIMNVYSKDVFFNNMHFVSSYHYFPNDLGINIHNLSIQNAQECSFKRKKFCAAIYAYRNPTNSSLIYDNIEISLNQKRQDLAIFLYEKDKCDILGSDWPKNIDVLEESGFENGGNNWWDRKISILKNYKFNICIENTAFPYYCTEKIWHSIISGCLPIYSSDHTKIYETFPLNSFVDVSHFEKFDDLYNFINNMTEDEFDLRYQLCYKTLLDSLKNTNSDLNKINIVEKFVHNIVKLVNE